MGHSRAISNEPAFSFWRWTENGLGWRGCASKREGEEGGGGGERLDWRWKWRHRWTSPRFSDGCNETSPFNGKTPSHRALRFFIFTGRSFLCFIIVLNLFELQSFYIHQFRHSCVRVCVCVWKNCPSFFFPVFFEPDSTSRADPRNVEIEAMEWRNKIINTL